MKKIILSCLVVISLQSQASFYREFPSSNNFNLIDKSFSLKNLFKLHRGHDEIVLTFDDGPTPGVTDKILDVLKKKNVSAAFFVIASKAKRYPELVQRIKDEGHIVANHSYNHTILSIKKLDPLHLSEIIKLEILDAHEIIVPYMQSEEVFYFRAPGGEWNSSYADILNETEVGKKYIGPVFWDVGGVLKIVDNVVEASADWDCWKKNILIDECLSGYVKETEKNRGGVILMHDLVWQSPIMLEMYIDSMVEKYYSFKTLNDVDWSVY